MRFYRKISVFENISRTRTLTKFRQLVVAYFGSIGRDQISGEIYTTEATQQCRNEINKILNSAGQLINTAGVDATIYYTPPPVTQRPAINIDLIQNIFNLHRYQIGSQHVIDFIDRAIGNYENDKTRSILRTINPLFWVGLVLDWLVSLPFKFIGSLGFNQQAVETSTWGKLLRGILYFITTSVTLVASALSILYYLDLLQPLRRKLNF